MQHNLPVVIPRRDFLHATSALTGAAVVGVNYIDLAIRYGLDLPGVATANLGVHTIEQFRQNLAVVRRFQLLSREEQDHLATVGPELTKEWGPHFGPAV